MASSTVITPPRHYLNDGYGIKSWLLTRDHKRIALLYLVGVTFFFFIGGAMAVLIRLELATPVGDLVSDETYNKLFTMHGVMMVFFFLIPAIPAVLGNFLVPIMIGAKDLAFPKLNLLSWYIYIVGGLFTLYALVTGGVDTGWTFYTPFSTVSSTTNVIPTALGFFDPRLGGDPVLFQHMFWFYSHPAVYIMILPAMGVISELVAGGCRKPV